MERGEQDPAYHALGNVSPRPSPWHQLVRRRVIAPYDPTLCPRGVGRPGVPVGVGFGTVGAMDDGSADAEEIGDFQGAVLAAVYFSTVAWRALVWSR